MINLESLEKVGNSKFGSHFTKPLYGDYCFSNIPEKKHISKNLFEKYFQKYYLKNISAIITKYQNNKIT